MQQTLAAPASVSTPAPVAVPKLWLTVKDVSKLLSLGVRTLWRMVKAGQIPQPHRFSRKLVRFDRTEIVEFVLKLRAARQAKEGK
jgi:excisionase family DNA binding protein